METADTDALRLRYGAGHVPPELTHTPHQGTPGLDTLLAHRSVRRFANRPLPDATPETLTAAAQSASTSSNLQSWSVVAIENDERKRRAAELCGDQDWINTAPLFLIWCADLSRLDAVSQREGLPGEALDYAEMFVTAAIDAALAAQNAAVAAELLGLGTCYVGAARNHPREMADFLGLPLRAVALFGLAVGWPEQGANVKPRLPQTSILHRETYNPAAFESDVNAYNETLAAFNGREGRSIPAWSRQAAERVAGVSSLMGRESLREILRERGFPLR